MSSQSQALRCAVYVAILIVAGFTATAHAQQRMCAVDGATSDIICMDLDGSNEITALTAPASTSETYVTYNDFAYVPSTRDIYLLEVTYTTSTTSSRVVRGTLDEGATEISSLTPIWNVANEGVAIAADPLHNALYVSSSVYLISNRYNGSLLRANLDGTSPSTIATFSPDDLFVNGDEGKLYMAAGTLLQYDLDGTNRRDYGKGSRLRSLQQLGYERNTGDFFIGGTISGGVTVERWSSSTATFASLYPVNISYLLVTSVAYDVFSDGLYFDIYQLLDDEGSLYLGDGDAIFEPSTLRSAETRALTVITQCELNAYLDEDTCTTCTQCADDEYMLQRCGATFDRQCATCTVCGEGQYTISECEGTNDAECGFCDSSCLTCDDDGMGDCTSCPDGSYLYFGYCVECWVCADDEYAAVACGGTNDAECSSCDSSCVTCDGPGPAHCTSCGFAKYLNDGECTDCSYCDDTQFYVSWCDEGTDTVCQDCAVCDAGTYQAAPCDLLTDTDCQPCDETCATCTGAGSADCTTCADGHYFMGGLCFRCSECDGDTHVVSECTATQDTVCADGARDGGVNEDVDAEVIADASTADGSAVLRDGAVRDADVRDADVRLDAAPPDANVTDATVFVDASMNAADANTADANANVADAAPTRDSSIAEADAATAARDADVENTADGSISNGGSSGCGCTIADPRRPHAPSLLILAAALAVAYRRRRANP